MPASTTGLAYSHLQTPLGPITILVSQRGLAGVSFGMAAPEGARLDPQATSRAVRQLSEYFHGKRRNFQLRLDWRGTAFQRQVWRALLRIPYGQTRSYGDVARRLRPRAFGRLARAVGGANRANPWAIVVPCHRVIGADGGLTGYGGPGGVNKKRWLLHLERAGGRPRA